MSETEETDTTISRGYRGLGRHYTCGEALGTRTTTATRIETTGGLIDSDLIYGKFTRDYLQQPGKYLTALGSKIWTLRSTGLYWVAPGPHMSQ